jgi:hypothetical protein
LPHQGDAKHKRVGNYEHPISQEPAVDDKSERGRNLADKEPLRDSLPDPVTLPWINLSRAK